MPITDIQFLDALPDAALIVGTDGRIETANQRASIFFRSALERVEIGSVIRQPEFLSAFAKAKDNRQQVEADVEFYGAANRNARIFIAPLQGHGGMLIVLRDFTREQAIEKMRSDFVANASHEMRTPLASIIGSIETLKGAAKNDAKAHDMFLDTMLTQGNRMKRLIDDLLSLSRIELNEHVRPSNKVMLTNIARQAKANLSEAASAAKVNVEILGSEPVEVSGDPDELLQVAQNLLENAFKYGGAGGRVEIDCYAEGRNGVLSVRDFGKGIAEIHIPRLTERFYRVNTQESRSRGGTGLGLAIVKHILLRHQGKLEIRSQEGAGSFFMVSIPLFKA
jgi:two-component system, OmpR family, phosphate regulon sensor histidine kinase PhoR